MSKTDGALTPRWIAAVVLTIGAAAALRLVGLQSGLWYDEIVTLVDSVRPPLVLILTSFPGVNTHPFYSVLAHASIAGFGDTAWALRLPASLFGIASVWMVFVLGTRLTGRLEAWAGAAVLATSYHHIWFSQNARGYTMLGFFVLLATYSLIRARESGTPRDYTIYALACAAGVYTHLTVVFVVAAHAVAIVVDWAIRRRAGTGRPLAPMLWALTGAAVLSAVAYAPFAPALIEQLSAGEPQKAAQVATASWAMSETVRSLLSGAGVPAALAGGVIALIGGVALARRVPLALALLVLPAVTTAMASLILGLPIRPRFFFFLSGPAALFIGHGLGRLTRRSPTGIVTATFVLIAMSAVALPRNYQVPKQDFDGAVRFLEGEESAGARIAGADIICMPLQRYFGKSGWPCVNSVDDLRSIAAGAAPVRVVFTLADYISEAALREELRTSCPVVRSFPATLGGGEIIVCAPPRR